MNKIIIRLDLLKNLCISRSSAREILPITKGVDAVVLDFDKVPTVGQAFADEVFRVFHHKYPHIKIEVENMSEGVKFMVERARNEAKKLQQ